MIDRDRYSRWKRLFWLFTTIIIAVAALRFIFLNPRQTVISPLPDSMTLITPRPTSRPGSFTIFKRKKDPDELEKKIVAVVDDSWNDYSIVVEDFGSDFAVRLSEGEIFVAASVNKVPILAVLYYLAGKGEIDLDRDITIQQADIQDYGTGSIRYEKPGSVYAIKTLAKLMIKQSDNTAAYILANHIIGFDRLTDIVNQWGLTQTDMIKNKTSNQDLAKVFRMIYEEKITDAALTKEMLSFLKDTDFETRLPGKLPKGTIVYHKIGTEVGIIHDAGIISDGTHVFYLGVFTNGTTEDESTDALIADIAKTVYEYMK